jgi:hypothetical protein
LKGADRVLWLVFNRFDLHRGVHIVCDQEEVKSMWDKYEEMQDMREHHFDLFSIRQTSETREETPLEKSESSLASNEDMRNYRRQISFRRGPPLLRYYEDGEKELDPVIVASMTFELRLQRILRIRHIQGFEIGSPKSSAKK